MENMGPVTHPSTEINKVMTDLGNSLPYEVRLEIGSMLDDHQCALNVARGSSSA